MRFAPGTMGLRFVSELSGLRVATGFDKVHQTGQAPLIRLRFRSLLRA